MPQLDIATFPSQIFWLIVSFVILYICISKLIMPKISKVLLEREKKIKENIKESEILYTKTENISNKCENLRKETKEESKKIISDIKNKTNKKVLENTILLKKELDKRLEIAEKEILNKRNKVLSNLSSISALLSEEILKKISNKEINTKELNLIIKKNLKV